jgi:hypothetical protein
MMCVPAHDLRSFTRRANIMESRLYASGKNQLDNSVVKRFLYALPGAAHRCRPEGCADILSVKMPRRHCLPGLHQRHLAKLHWHIHQGTFMLPTSITPEGRFRIGVHAPSYTVANLRQQDHHAVLGHFADGIAVDNRENFPEKDVSIAAGRTIYEIRNAFPFRGCTFIDSNWAIARAGDPGSIRIHPPQPVSMRSLLGDHCPPDAVREIVTRLPLPLRYQLAATSTDADELVWLAQSCCRLLINENGVPSGLRYIEENGRHRPDIDDFELFETIANNPYLHDVYKEVMVLRPGVQGNSEIVGDYSRGGTQVLEYLRGNSYIPWGHYAANCGPASIRYRIADLTAEDMTALRHLYYQRIFLTIADKQGIAPPVRRRRLTAEEVESLRQQIVDKLTVATSDLESLATLWGWNFGYDFSGSGYRLHASHQMIHQQYAMVPQWVNDIDGSPIPAYSCGDLVAEVVECYRQEYDSDFFADYLRAIAGNSRIDGGEGAQSLVVWQDTNVQLFVPKAQVSQWEIQLMVTADSNTGPVGNVIEANAAVRHSLDTGILKAQQVLAGLGATMVTSIEYPKRIGVQNGQRLLYSFLPKLPWSMGAFSEAQGRFILGHYPEDFAEACRRQLG